MAQRWGAGILDGPLPLHSHGAQARRSHGAGGARLEAGSGFPSLYDVGLPALREGRARSAGDELAARVQSCFALVATLEDTNLLHRGGADGLAFARNAASRFLRHGGVGHPDWRLRAEAVHRAFTTRRLSPGGVGRSAGHGDLRRRARDGARMTLAILCSGQGPQHCAMFALTGDVPAATALFDQARSLLDGRDPRDLVRTAGDQPLHVNRTGQILCTLQPLAALAALGGSLGGSRIVAGYSVGEVAAWAVAGLIRPSAVLAVAARRAEVMDAVSAPGDGLLFVRGLDRDAIDTLCSRHGGAVAIINPGDAFLLGGDRDALMGLAEAARAAGASRIVRVAVAVASHTPRLAAASAPFRRSLGTTRRRGSNAARRPASVRHRCRPGLRRERGPRQTGRTDLSHGSLGRRSRGLCRGGGDRLPRTRPWTRADRDGRPAPIPTFRPGAWKISRP